MSATDSIGRDVIEAKAAIVRMAATRESWTAFDLKKHARERWSAATMGLALYALVDEGRVVRGDDHRVRLAVGAAQERTR